MLVRNGHPQDGAHIQSGSEEDVPLKAAKRMYSAPSRSISLEALLKEKQQSKSIRWDQLDALAHQASRLLSIVANRNSCHDHLFVIFLFHRLS